MASLTARECEILALCAAGMSDLEIASELGISPYTVGNHIRRILAKTSSANRAQAVAWGYEHRVLGTGTDGAPDTEGSPETQDDALRSGDGAAAALARPAPSDLGRITRVTMLPRAKESQVGALGLEALHLMEGLQEALVDPGRWDDILLEYARAFRSHLPLLTWTHLPSRAKLSYTRCPTLDPEWIERYDTKYVQLTPVMGQLLDAPDFFGTTEDIDFQPSFYTSPFYTEFMRPLDHWMASAWTIRVDEAWMASIFLAQPRAHVPTLPRERELGAIIFPFVRHALNTLWHQARHEAELLRGALVARQRRHAPLDALGGARDAVLLLSASGHLLDANHAGERLLRNGRYLNGNATGRLYASSERSRPALDVAIRRAVRAADRRTLATIESIALEAADHSSPRLRAAITPCLTRGVSHPTPLARAAVVLTVQTPEGTEPVRERGMQ